MMVAFKLVPVAAAFLGAVAGTGGARLIAGVLAALLAALPPVGAVAVMLLAAMALLRPRLSLVSRD